jgi:prepilin-type N-terminal cleavage/methylation domain-containing protein
MKHNIRKKAFTLIELLLVISIISLLSAIVLSSIQEARDNAQITKFGQDWKQIQIAVELYKNKNDGSYPLSDGSLDLDLLVPEYIPKLYPQTPFNKSDDEATIVYSRYDDTNNTAQYILYGDDSCGVNIDPRYEKLINFGWKRDSFLCPDDFGLMLEL